MRLAFTVLFIFLRIFAGAQPSTPGILWQHNYGGTKDDELRSMELTDDGGFICAGYAKSSDGDIDSIQGASDFWVMKCDSAGTIQWQRTYGGTSNDWARSISITSDGGYIVAGYSKSNDGDVSGNHGDFDYWVLRLTSTGDIMWQKSYGGSKKDNAYRAIETYDGNFIVAGFTSSTDGDVSGNHGRQDYWVLKLDANGNIIWKKALGGAQNDQASMVIETSDHDYVIIGFAHSSDGNVNDNKGAEDIWVVKLSKGGKMRWKKSYGGSKNDAGRWIEQTPDGGFLLTGYSASDDIDATINKGKYDFWLIKTDGSGNIQWQHSYGGSMDDYPYYVHRCSDGTIVIAGTTSSDDGDVTEQHGKGDYWVVKTDSTGNMLWQKSFGGSEDDVARVSLSTIDNELLIAGYASSSDGDVNNNHGGYDGWVIKTCTAPANLIDVIGNTDICNTGQVMLEASNGINYSYKWFKDGNEILGATDQIYSATVAGDYTVQITAAGSCSSTSDPVTVYTSCKSGAGSNALQLSVSPNPSDGKFSLSIFCDKVNDFCEVTLINLTGIVVMKRHLYLNNGETEVVFEMPAEVSKGMYLLKVKTREDIRMLSVGIDK